jgi:hypothetical protein
LHFRRCRFYIFVGHFKSLQNLDWNESFRCL